MNKKVALIGVILALVVIFIVNSMLENKAKTNPQDFTNIDKTQSSKFSEDGSEKVSPTIDNSSDELNAVLVALEDVKITQENQQTNLRSAMQEVKKLKEELVNKDKKIDSLNNKLKNGLKNVDSKLSQEKKRLEEKLIEEKTINQKLGVDNNKPVVVNDNEVPILNRPDNNNSLDQLVSYLPTKLAGALNNSDGKVTSAQLQNSKPGIVWYEADDAIVSETGDVTYPLSSEEISGVNFSNNTLQNDEQNKEDETKLSTVHEIYTIPADSTLWNAVSLGSMIGRVPKNGVLKNPYGFKVILSNENMATNGIYIPNLKNMVLSGYLEGDMLMECVRGTIDSATYTFLDGRVATTRAKGSGTSGSSNRDGLARISDQWGNECIPGTYVSTLKEYITYVGGTSSIASIGSLLRDAGSITTTDGTTITSTLASNASVSSVGGAALEGGAGAAQEFLEEQLGDAFSAVLIEAGENLVINIDQQIEIDYDTEGRQVVNYNNVEEFLN